jgi:hypothetical protein
MPKTDMKDRAPLRWPLLFFGDGFFAEVRRGPVLSKDGKEYVMIINPEGAVWARHQDLISRASGNLIEVRYPTEMFRILSMDPACPRFKVYCSVKGDNTEEMKDKTHLLSMIDSLKQKTDELTLRLMNKEEDVRLLLTDVESFVDKYKTIFDKGKSREPGYAMGGMTEGDMQG